MSSYMNYFIIRTKNKSMLSYYELCGAVKSLYSLNTNVKDVTGDTLSAPNKRGTTNVYQNIVNNKTENIYTSRNEEYVHFDRMEKLCYDFSGGSVIAEKHYVYTIDGFRLNLYRLVKNNKNNENNQGNNINNCNLKEKKREVFCLSHGLFESCINFTCKGYDSLAYQMFSNNYDVWLCNSRGNSFTEFVGKKVAMKELKKKYSIDDLKDLGLNPKTYYKEKENRKNSKKWKDKEESEEKNKKIELKERYDKLNETEICLNKPKTLVRKRNGVKTIQEKNNNIFLKTNSVINPYGRNCEQVKNTTMNDYYDKNTIQKTSEEKHNINNNTQHWFNFFYTFFQKLKCTNKNIAPEEKKQNNKNSSFADVINKDIDSNRCSYFVEKMNECNSTIKKGFVEKQGEYTQYYKGNNIKIDFDNNEEYFYNVNERIKDDDREEKENVEYQEEERDEDDEIEEIDKIGEDETDDEEENYKKENSSHSWTFIDMSTKDLPSIIKYIKNETKIEKLIYVGFSQGSMQLLISSCLNEFVSNSIKQCYLLSLPIILRTKKELLKSMKVLLWLSKCSDPFLKGKSFIQNFFPRKIGEYLIANVAHILTHKVLKYYNETIEKNEQHIYFCNTPNGSTSVANLNKWISCFNNFPVTDLIEKYSYRCSYPKTLFYGNKDCIVDSQSSIIYMKSIFKNCLNVIINKNWSHLDPLWSDNKKIVISYILRDVKK